MKTFHVYKSYLTTPKRKGGEISTIFPVLFKALSSGRKTQLLNTKICLLRATEPKANQNTFAIGENFRLGTKKQKSASLIGFNVNSIVHIVLPPSFAYRIYWQVSFK